MYTVELLDGADALALNQLIGRYLDGTGWVSGGVVSPQGAGFAVDVAEGEVFVEGSPVTFDAGGVTLPAQDPNQPRKDVIFVDPGGALKVEPGEPGAPRPQWASRDQTYHPEPPDMTDVDGAELAVVWVPGGQSGQSDTVPDDIQDRRLPITLIEAVPPDVQDGGATVTIEASAIDAGQNISATDNGDGSATLDVQVSEVSETKILAKTRRINV